MVKHQSIITKNSQETTRLGEQMGASLISRSEGGVVSSNRVFCLYGDLGSGKTTFTQGLAKGCGIQTRLLSPTFIIVRRYEIPNTSGYLYHLDLYRLQTEQQLLDIGLEEILHDEQSCVVIEWAEKLGSLLPTPRIEMKFTLMEDGSHVIDTEYYI